MATSTKSSLEAKENTQLRISRLLVETDQPFLTTDDIGDILDISKPTVLRHVDEASARPNIASRKVGQTTVYYQTDVPTTTNRLDAVSNPRKAVLEHRAMWLDAKERFYRQLENHSRSQILLHNALYDYALHCGGLQYQPSYVEDGEHEITLSVNSELTEEEVKYADSELLLLESEEYGEIRGISGYLRFGESLRSELGDILNEDLGGDELERICPDTADIVHAGNHIDSFTKKLHGIHW